MIQRGSIVTVATQGDYGKPRPALVIQSDMFSGIGSLTICPLTSAVDDDRRTMRVGVSPDEQNGLLVESMIMVDKITTAPVGKVGTVIGQANSDLMKEVDAALTAFLGLN
jgi:mRNA interferase MazF